MSTLFVSISRTSPLVVTITITFTTLIFFLLVSINSVTRTYNISLLLPLMLLSGIKPSCHYQISLHTTSTPSINGSSMSCNTSISPTNSTQILFNIFIGSYNNSIYYSWFNILIPSITSIFPPSLEESSLVPNTLIISSIDTCLLFNINDTHKSLTVLLSVL